MNAYQHGHSNCGDNGKFRASGRIAIAKIQYDQRIIARRGSKATRQSAHGGDFSVATRSYGPMWLQWLLSPMAAEADRAIVALPCG